MEKEAKKKSEKKGQDHKEEIKKKEEKARGCTWSLSTENFLLGYCFLWFEILLLIPFKLCLKWIEQEGGIL